MKFCAFNDLKRRKAICVDGIYAHGLNLSHWKGANIYPEWQADTSAEIVLNFLEKSNKINEFEWVTANHFDIDGFLGVWAILNPELALKHKEILKAAAEIGDFRAYQNNEVHDFALKLVCWINQKEKELFYRPFGYIETEEDEKIACVRKFDYFLPQFKNVLLNIQNFQKDWEKEYQQVENHLEQLKEANQSLFPEIGLAIIETENPVHYYALFSKAFDCDIVLSLYDNQRYELEFRYTTWVDISSRKTFPRLKLHALLQELNSLEKSGFQWFCDSIYDTGPILRLEDKKIGKSDRFANPFEREIYSSSIPKNQFKNLIINYLRENYKNIEPGNFFTWKKIEELNQAF